MNDDLNDPYQEVILEHATKPDLKITVEPVRDHLEQVLWGRLEELFEKK